MSEQVLVVPREALVRVPGPLSDGFSPGDGEAFLDVVDREGRFVPREPAEQDPSLKQIIPYAVLLYQQQVFLLERSSQGGEARLHRKVSLGVGGHVNPPDGNLPGSDAPATRDSGAGGGTAGRLAVANAFERELHEELVLETGFRAEVVGVLNDDSNSVGRVHFGIVYQVHLEAPRVRVREGEVLRGEFVRVDSLWRHRSAMETWSQILQGVFWPAP